MGIILLIGVGIAAQLPFSHFLARTDPTRFIRCYSDRFCREKGRKANGSHIGHTGIERHTEQRQEIGVAEMTQGMNSKKRSYDLMH